MDILLLNTNYQGFLGSPTNSDGKKFNGNKKKINIQSNLDSSDPKPNFNISQNSFIHFPKRQGIFNNFG